MAGNIYDYSSRRFANKSKKSLFYFEDILKREKNFDVIYFFCFLLLFLPSVTFGLLTAEIFPWAIIISFIFLKKYNYWFILVLGYLSLSAFFTAIFSGNPLIILESIRSLSAYLNVLLSFALIFSLPSLWIIKLAKLVKFLFLFLFLLGLLQFSGLVGILDPIFKFLVPRATSTSLIEINRGVTLLASEPARAGNEMTFIYILIRYIFVSKKIRPLIDLIIGIYLLIVIQSGMAIMMYFLFIVLVYRIKLLFFIIVGSVALSFINLDFIGGRSIDLFRQLSILTNLREIISYLIGASGHRLISIYASYVFGLSNLLGGGIGNWTISSIEALNMTGYDLSTIPYFLVKGNGNAVSVRASGFFSNLILDVGFLGSALVLFYILKSIRKYWAFSKEAKIIIITFLFKIFFVGSIGHPIAWITTTLCLRLLYLKHHLNSSFYSHNNSI